MTPRLNLTEAEREEHFREQRRRANRKHKAKTAKAMLSPGELARKNAAVAKWARERYWVRKAQAFEYLGGKCEDCGISAISLEFDHRDPRTKSFNITHGLTGMRWEKILAELDKCDLRCVSCHQHRTAVQRIESVDVLGTLLQGV